MTCSSSFLRRMATTTLTLCALALAAGAQAQTQSTPFQAIDNPAGPIKNLFIGNDLSAQVDHELDPNAFQIYPAQARPADYGTIVALGGTLYTPDFSNHRSSAAASPLGTRTPFTAVSQTPPSGTGTASDPYSVTTVVDVGSTGIRISQNDSYVSGQDTFRTDITLQNTGTAAQTLVLYRAMDCYLGASDSGYGAASGGTISCTKNANNTPPGRVLSLIPITANSSYRQDRYGDIWRHIATQQPFDDNCAQCANSVDNGMGLSWSLTIPAGGSTTVTHLTLFSPTGNQPLPTSKTVTPGAITAGEMVSYTITVNNPNTAGTPGPTLIDTLPAGFSYVPGSSVHNGSPVADPTIAGQMLTWDGGSLSGISGSSNITLTFTAQSDANLAAGTYYNRVQGAIPGFTVLDSGDTAPVVVTAVAPNALTLAKAVSPSSAAPGETVSYTITVNNPNATAVALDTLVDTLPNGLSYVAGSSTGATTADPAIAGQVLTWNGPLNVAANGSLTLRFSTQLDANLAAGTLYNSVSATATGYTVQPSGNTAPLTVRNTAPRAIPQTIPTLSQWGLLMMSLMLGLLALRQLKAGRL